MVGIVRDDEEAAVRSYAKDEQIAFPVLLDPQGAATLGFGTTGQPETYVIAPDGVVACGTLGRSSVAALDAWLAAAREGSVCT
jgi:hypothetical protein